VGEPLDNLAGTGKELRDLDPSSETDSQKHCPQAGRRSVRWETKARGFAYQRLDFSSKYPLLTEGREEHV
jgi:hypothetical protein